MFGCYHLVLLVNGFGFAAKHLLAGAAVQGNDFN